MSGKIAGFFREYIFGLSIVTMIVGLLVLFIGILGIWFADVATDVLSLADEAIVWCPYVLIIGLIVFGAGLYYLYSFIKNKNFVLEEIETNKRSEFLKRHSDLKDSIRYLPSKYKEMLKEKERELKIK
jgi:H+/Cl- antiporter ClcA